MDVESKEKKARIEFTYDEINFLAAMMLCFLPVENDTKSDDSYNVVWNKLELAKAKLDPERYKKDTHK